MEKELNAILQENLKIMVAAQLVLQNSYARVLKIDFTKDLSDAEKETCEALTARHSRLSDFLFQKIFRGIDLAELIFEGTQVDVLNRMEKRGLIDSAEKWRELRFLRNEIVHEYLIDASNAVLKKVIQTAPLLLQCCDQIRVYCKRNFLIQ